MDDDFAREVLRLVQGQTIEYYDNELKHQAQLLGIPLVVEKLNVNSKPTSTATYLSQARTSLSNESQTSHSTGLTSNLSRTSREHEALLYPKPHIDRRKSGTSVSVKDYDSILSNSKHSYHRLSLNFSPPMTPSPSTFSLPLSSSRESSPRRHIIRSLSRLRLHRRSGSSSSVKNDDCPHCPYNSNRHNRRPSHTLACGHSYCTLALRRVIQRAVVDLNDVPPTCCKRPIPGSLIERVMTHEEQEKLMSNMVAWENDAASVGSSVNATNTDLAPVRENERKPRSSRQSLAYALDVLNIQVARDNLQKAMNMSDFRGLREKQEDQRDRCIELDRRTRHTLSKECQTRKDDVARSHEQQLDNLVEKHSLNISRVEDKHVHDEMDLRAVQDTEISNMATALRHMEAFCRGECASGEPHHRIITEQDRGELAKTRHRADQMHRKHEGEIGVLRGEQNRRMTLRVHRQEMEVNQSELRQKRELEAIQEQHDGALREWEDQVETMRETLQEWWRLEVEIWRKTLEKQTGVVFDAVLLSVEWPEDGTEDVQKERRDTLLTLSTRADMETKRGGSSSPSSDIGKEMGISTTFAVRGSVIGQAL